MAKKLKSQTVGGRRQRRSNPKQQEEPIEILAMQTPDSHVPEIVHGTAQPHENPAASEGQETTEVPQINHGDLFAEPLESLTALGQDEYTELRLCGKRMVEHYWKFGEILKAIKAQVGHGPFTEFCEKQSWELNWVRRSLRIVNENPKLEDCIGMGVIEACHYEHIDDEDEDEDEEDQHLDENGDHLDEDNHNADEGNADKGSSGSQTAQKKTKDPGTVHNPPKWLLHHSGEIVPIDRETKTRYHKGKDSFAKGDGVLFKTKPEAEAAFAKWRETIPRFPNCKRVLLPEERESHPNAWTTYILNDGRVVRIAEYSPPGSANRIWYSWDGSVITKIDPSAIRPELYGISTEDISRPDDTQIAKLLEGHKTYEVLVALRGTIRLTGTDEDDVKKILDANWKDWCHRMAFTECEALDAHEAPPDKDEDDEEDEELETGDGDEDEAENEESVSQAE